MLAVIKTGGKQYLVTEGEMYKVEKLEGAVGDTVTLTDVFLIASEDGKTAKVGTPIVEGGTVEAEIVEQGRAKKITVVKYKAKTRYKRTKGHRQHFTKIKILSIAG